MLLLGTLLGGCVLGEAAGPVDMALWGISATAVWHCWQAANVGLEVLRMVGGAVGEAAADSIVDIGVSTSEVYSQFAVSSVKVLRGVEFGTQDVVATFTMILRMILWTIAVTLVQKGLAAVWGRYEGHRRRREGQEDQRAAGLEVRRPVGSTAEGLSFRRLLRAKSLAVAVGGKARRIAPPPP
jgi:hypothetical protein